MVAGKRALLDYRIKYANIKEISALLSEPQHTTAEALARFSADFEETRAKLKASRLELAREIAKREEGSEKNAVFVFPDWTLDELREFSNAMVDRVDGMLVTVCGSDGDYKYIISSKTVNLSQQIKEINAALSGRGGGKPGMVQGSFLTTAEEIKKYFS
jgi:alanyl-tRNA synthetase